MTRRSDGVERQDRRPAARLPRPQSHQGITAPGIRRGRGPAGIRTRDRPDDLLGHRGYPNRPRGLVLDGDYRLVLAPPDGRLTEPRHRLRPCALGRTAGRAVVNRGMLRSTMRLLSHPPPGPR